ncbi:hypothetical protein PCE1_003992 [Barthelona sp. PCE]
MNFELKGNKLTIADEENCANTVFERDIILSPNAECMGTIKGRCNPDRLLNCVLSPFIAYPNNLHFRANKRERVTYFTVENNVYSLDHTIEYQPDDECHEIRFLNKETMFCRMGYDYYVVIWDGDTIGSRHRLPSLRNGRFCGFIGMNAIFVEKCQRNLNKIAVKLTPETISSRSFESQQLEKAKYETFYHFNEFSDSFSVLINHYLSPDHMCDENLSRAWRFFYSDNGEDILSKTFGYQGGHQALNGNMMLMNSNVDFVSLEDGNECFIASGNCLRTEKAMLCDFKKKIFIPQQKFSISMNNNDLMLQPYYFEGKDLMRGRVVTDSSFIARNVKMIPKFVSTTGFMCKSKENTLYFDIPNRSVVYISGKKKVQIGSFLRGSELRIGSSTHRGQRNAEFYLDNFNGEYFESASKALINRNFGTEVIGLVEQGILCMIDYGKNYGNEIELKKWYRRGDHVASLGYFDNGHVVYFNDTTVIAYCPKSDTSLVFQQNEDDIMYSSPQTLEGRINYYNFDSFVRKDEFHIDGHVHRGIGKFVNFVTESVVLTSKGFYSPGGLIVDAKAEHINISESTVHIHDGTATVINVNASRHGRLIYRQYTFSANELVERKDMDMDLREFLGSLNKVDLSTIVNSTKLLKGELSETVLL